jgi:hypothetical protein
VDNGITFVVPMLNPFPALYTKLREGKCLIYIGREGCGVDRELGKPMFMRFLASLVTP